MEASIFSPSIYPFTRDLSPLNTIQPHRKPATRCDFDKPFNVTTNKSGANVAIGT